MNELVSIIMIGTSVLKELKPVCVVFGIIHLIRSQNFPKTIISYSLIGTRTFTPKESTLKNDEEYFLFYRKNSLRSGDIQKNLLPSSPLFPLSDTAELIEADWT